MQYHQNSYGTDEKFVTKYQECRSVFSLATYFFFLETLRFCRIHWATLHLRDIFYAAVRLIYF